MTLDARVREVAAEAARLAPEPVATEARALATRLDGPLRVAIAGRLKAGKSTLLNALVGERLAPTDAGECTTLVTWYHEALGYEVSAHVRDGTQRPLPFTRAEERLEISLAGLPASSVERLDVGWPSSALRATTLIDTPGLASLSSEHSRRTQEFLAIDQDRVSDADAVVYLMRHVHRRDVEFLDAFMDRSVPNASPVHAVAVLSRADEIGGARPDALDSAARIAARYEADPQLRTLCTTVLPVAGLLAETGATLREDEVAALRVLAALPGPELDDLLVSADRFRDVARSPLTAEVRHQLLERLGVFGVRFALDTLRRGGGGSASELAAALLAVSGVGRLRAVLEERFLPRARLLQARGVLAGLRGLARRVEDAGVRRALEGSIERVEAGAHELAELRLLHLVATGEARLRDDEVAEVQRVCAPGDPYARAGLDGAAGPDALRGAAVAGIERWRTRAEDPFLDPVTAAACATLARSYEAMFAAAPPPDTV